LRRGSSGVGGVLFGETARPGLVLPGRAVD